MDRQQILYNIRQGLFHSDIHINALSIAALIHKMSTIEHPYIQTQYKGVLYVNKGAIKGHTTDVELDPMLIPQLDILIAEKANLEEDQAIVDSYVRKALNISETVEDVIALLDKSLSKYILPDWLITECTLTKGEVYAFKQANVPALEIIKKLRLTNLIANR